MSNVTPIRRAEPERDWDTIRVALTQARAVVDILQGAAAHAAIEPPASEESLARTLMVVLDLLDKVEICLWPADDEDDEDPEVQP